MARLCDIIAKSTDGSKAICIDHTNKDSIIAYINQSERHKKKWRHIVELILTNQRNPELYDKENINGKASNVTAMKFFKGQENDRLYCIEQRTPNGIFIIVAVEIYLKKKTTKVSKKEIPIINKISNYEYEIKENSD